MAIIGAPTEAGVSISVAHIGEAVISSLLHALAEPVATVRLLVQMPRANLKLADGATLPREGGLRPWILLS